MTHAQSHRAGPDLAETLPVICLITADEDFQGEIEAELAPWYRVRRRNHYGDAAIWVRESGLRPCWSISIPRATRPTPASGCCASCASWSAAWS